MFELVVLGFLLASAPGCTFVGLAVGASVPNTETYGNPAAGVAGGPALATALAARDINYGDAVEVDLQPPPALDEHAFGPPAPRSQSSTLQGRLGLLAGEQFTIVTPDTEYRVPIARVRTARVRHGNHWAGGLLLGLMIDFLLFGTAAHLIAGSMGDSGK